MCARQGREAMDKADEWVLTQCGREVIALRRERDKWLLAEAGAGKGA